MGSRFLPLTFLASSSILVAAPMRNLNTIEYQYIDQELSSRSPNLERPDHLNILSGRSLFLMEESKLNCLGQLGATQGNSGTTSFTALEALARASRKELRYSDSLEASWIRSHGADSMQTPLEDTVAGTGAPFTATQLSYRHQHELNAQDSISTAAGISRNLDSSSDLESRALDAAWTRQLSRSWSNTLDIRRGTQQIRQAAAADSWQLQNQDLWQLNAEWSAQSTVGGLQQNIAGTKKNSFLGGAAMAYVLRQITVRKENDPGINADSINPPDRDRIENIRTQSQFRFGWLRSLDERRKGDPQFLADQYFMEGLWAIDAEQNLQIDLQRTQSRDNNVRGLSGFNRKLANLDYRWTHPVGPSSAALLGTLGFGVTQENIKQQPLGYSRQQLRVSYGVTF